MCSRAWSTGRDLPARGQQGKRRMKEGRDRSQRDGEGPEAEDRKEPGRLRRGRHQTYSVALRTWKTSRTTFPRHSLKTRGALATRSSRGTGITLGDKREGWGEAWGPEVANPEPPLGVSQICFQGQRHSPDFRCTCRSCPGPRPSPSPVAWGTAGHLAQGGGTAHLGTIIARSTVGPAGTSRTGGTLHTTLARETSLALEGKDVHVTAAPEAWPSLGHREGARKNPLTLAPEGPGAPRSPGTPCWGKGE